MVYLITGGLGQIGSHVADLLIERGDQVVVIDNLSTGRKVHLSQSDRLTVVEGDIADYNLLESIFKKYKPNYVIHTAASYKDPNDWISDVKTNCLGAVNLLKLSVDSSIKRFIYYQTALCYGLAPEINPIPLDYKRDPGSSSYSISKTLNEYYLELSGLDFVTFRLANVTGPRHLAGPLPIFYKRLTEGKKCFVTRTRRDFVCAPDLARVTLQALDGRGSGTYHFSSGEDVSILELYNAVVDKLGIKEYPEPEIRDIAADDVESILLEPSRTLNDFDIPGFTSMEKIVEQAVQYYQEYGVEQEFTHLKINNN